MHPPLPPAPAVSLPSHQPFAQPPDPLLVRTGAKDCRPQPQASGKEACRVRDTWNARGGLEKQPPVAGVPAGPVPAC